MRKKVLVLVAVLCAMLTGCGAFTEKSETTKCEITSELQPICEINFESIELFKDSTLS